MKAKEFLKLLNSASEEAEISIENGEIVITESKPKDITDRIKTFEDACKWCEENKPELCRQWRDYCNSEDDDVEAYLKLRIITAALNEGWEPTFAEDERRYYCIYELDGEIWNYASAMKIGCATPYTLYFKTRELAEYAATQFSDIYADFCGFKKGGEQ